MTAPSPKAAVRRSVLARRRTLGLPALHDAARALRDVVLAAPEVRSARCVAAYASTGTEPGTGPLLDALAAAGVQVLLPVLLPDGDLDWGRYAGTAGLQSAPRGLLEPPGPRLGVDAVLEADVVLVPGLAVDASGMRLGRGGGSYDRVLTRALARRRPPPWTCLLLHAGEVLDAAAGILPQEGHDVPVMAVATPSGLRRFG